MTSLTRSYLRVPYDLRTSKQVERRMIVDALHRLAHSGFAIKDYQYTGMGSFFFVDFILFHKYLGTRKMLSVELSEEIERRVRFNRPFQCVQLRFGRVGDVIPSLSRNRGHILWLDYDNVLSKGTTLDVTNAAAILPRGSILLVTVDVEPPIKDGIPKRWKSYFLSHVGEHCDPTWKMSDFAQSNLTRVNTRILESALNQGLVGRENLSFLPLFNFSYADGHEMLTVGGMFGTPEDKAVLDRVDFSDAIYIRRNLEIPAYKVPKFNLTRKERLYLDAAMPLRRRGWMPREFEMDKAEIKQYEEVYRYLPTYAELLA